MRCFHSGLLCEAALEEKGVALSYYHAEISILASIVQQWYGYEVIGQKLEKFSRNFRQNLLKLMTARDNEIKVLNHGDPWVNNMLFRYNAQNVPIDLIFVDFQLSLWGSPGFDLNYFFYTSCKLDELISKRELYLQKYYYTFENVLRSHNYRNIPSFESLKRCVQEREAFGFFACFAILPLVAMDKESSKDNSLDNLANENFAKRKIMESYSTPRVVETLKYALKKFDQLKIFD